MAKMSSFGLKGIGAAFVVWLSYLNSTFSPLLWVLLVLIFVDLLMNIHNEEKQFFKLGSAFIGLGIPTYIGQNVGHAGFEKYLVALMCLAYLQTVVPQLVAWLSKLKFSSDPKEQAVDQALVQAVVQQLSQKAETEAQAVINSAKEAGTGNQGGGVQ